MNLLLSVTFTCGVLIAVAHVVNQRFIAPVYDVAANLTAFGCAVGASFLLGHPIPAILSGVAILCWLVLARQTVFDRRNDVRRGTSLTKGAEVPVPRTPPALGSRPVIVADRATVPAQDR